jgi:hypothetical protein
MFAAALGLCFLSQQGLVHSVRAAQQQTGCNATAQVTAMAANGNAWAMNVTNQRVDGTWNKEVNLKVSTTVLVTATDVVAIDKKRGEHTYANVPFTTQLKPKFSNNYNAPGVNNLQTAPMSCTLPELDAALQVSLKNLLEQNGGPGLKKIKSRTLAAQTVNFQSTGSVKCLRPKADGAFTGRNLAVPVNNQGTGAAAN